jgi:hypothetical protein
MTPRKRPRAQVGDVFEIVTQKGLAYAQYSHWHDQYGELIRVLPGLYSARPNELCGVVGVPERYFVFYTLRAALSSKPPSAEFVASCCAAP